MIWLLEFAGYFICFSIIGTLLYAAARIYATSSALFLEAVDEFYAAIKPLVDDDETPGVILDDVAFMSSSIRDKSIAREICRASDEILAAPARHDHVIDEFLRRRPELKRCYEASMSSWIQAIISVSPLWGIYANYKIANPKAREKATRAAISEHLHPNGATC